MRINHPAHPYSSCEFRLAQIYTSWDSGPKTGRKWVISDNRWKSRTGAGLKGLFRVILFFSCKSCSVDLSKGPLIHVELCWSIQRCDPLLGSSCIHGLMWQKSARGRITSLLFPFFPPFLAYGLWLSLPQSSLVKFTRTSILLHMFTVMKTWFPLH